MRGRAIEITSRCQGALRKAKRLGVLAAMLLSTLPYLHLDPHSDNALTYNDLNSSVEGALESYQIKRGGGPTYTYGGSLVACDPM